MALPPWASAPSDEQLFVLVTGANSGVGLGIGERLIDEFLETRPLRAHLILIPTTRSPRKSRETIDQLRRHLEKTARTSRSLKARAGAGYNWEDTAARVHVLSVQVDLCDLPQVYQVAQRLVHGTISNPPLADGQPDALVDVRVPRLDSVIFNAGFGGWIGLNWPKLWRNLFRYGVIQSCTYPSFKDARPGAVLHQIPRHSNLVPHPPFPQALGSAYDTKPTSEVLGEVFCSNVFGHYVFAHRLLPLLSRASRSEEPGRIIWTSSVEPQEEHFHLDDIQAVRSEGPYESSKRLTDILALTCSLPAAAPYSGPWFRVEDPEFAASRPVPPRVYLTHPGVVASTLFPLHFLLFYCYKFALYLSRYLGSPWHPVDGYRGACAPAWAALQSQSQLDLLRAERVKWGSSCDRLGRTAVKKTEVEGWGWEGSVVDRAALRSDTAVGLQRMRIGRKTGAPILTPEKRVAFEALGARAWKEMEDLRHQWEGILGIETGETDIVNVE